MFDYIPRECERELSPNPWYLPHQWCKLLVNSVHRAVSHFVSVEDISDQVAQGLAATEISTQTKIN